MIRFIVLFSWSFLLFTGLPANAENKVPGSWNQQDIIPGKTFIFIHQWRDGKTFESRRTADQKFGFTNPGIAQKYGIDMTALDKEKTHPEINGCPRIITEPAISRHGGYGALSIEESRKLVPDKNKYEAFKKNIGGPFLGFLAAEWMDHALKGTYKKPFKQDNVFTFPTLPTTKEEALKRLEAYYRNGIADLAYGDIISLEGYRLFHHQALEWGAKFCMIEVGENIPAAQIQIAFVRGASRQYKKPWGTWCADCSYTDGGMSQRYYNTTANYYGPGKELDPKIYGPTMGHTESLEKRFQYVSFMSGSNINSIECVSFGGYYKDDNSDGILELSPWADLAQEMIRFGNMHQFDRGVTITPVGIVMEWAHGWSPSGCTPHKTWGYLELQKPDNMMDEVFNMFFPWNPICKFVDFWPTPETSFLVNNQFGDIFDVITDNARPETLASYPILFLNGDVRIEGDLEKRLQEYVGNGGILIANIEQMKNAEKDWKPENSGYAETDTVSAADTKTPAKETAFSYVKTSLKDGMIPVLTTADGNPLIIKQDIGKGQFYVSMVPWLLNKEGHIVRHIKPFIKSLSDKMLPFEINGNLEVVYNKSDAGWVLTLVNNDGIDKKFRTDPGSIDYSKKQIAKINYKGRPVDIREWVGNRSILWKQEKDNAQLQDIEILPGEFKIIEIKIKEDK